MITLTKEHLNQRSAEKDWTHLVCLLEIRHDGVDLLCPETHTHTETEQRDHWGDTPTLQKPNQTQKPNTTVFTAEFILLILFTVLLSLLLNSIPVKKKKKAWHIHFVEGENS